MKMRPRRSGPFLDAGIRVELKPSLVIFEEQTSSLHGRLSVLRSLKKDMEDYERTLSVLKSVLPRSTTEEEFEELFMEELDPTMTEKRNKIQALSQDPDSLSEADKESLDSYSTNWLGFLLRSYESPRLCQVRPVFERYYDWSASG